MICPVKLRYATICDDFDPKISLAKTLSETCRHISRFGTVSVPQSKILQSDWINQISVDVSRKVIEKWFYNQRDTKLLIDKWICVFEKWNLFQSFYKLNPIYFDIFEITSTDETSKDRRRTAKDNWTCGPLGLTLR